jgi:hypothetical protein
MKGNLVIVCRDQDAEAFDHLLAEYGAFQSRISSTAWYLRLEVAPEVIQEEILGRLGKYTTHYIFEADTVTYNTVDSDAAAALNSLFA